MRRTDARPRITRAAALLSLLAITAASGCVYRPNIQQGNLLLPEEVSQVTVGMSRSQVRYLLGTPMVSDPFAPQRWDYVYRMQYGRDDRPDTAHFIVRFEGDTVVGVETRDLPEPPRQTPRRKWAFWEKSSEQLPSEPVEPAAPPVPRPSPDANDPGSTGT